jgi:hypothetical protein
MESEDWKYSKSNFEVKSFYSYSVWYELPGFYVNFVTIVAQCHNSAIDTNPTKKRFLSSL